MAWVVDTCVLIDILEDEFLIGVGVDFRQDWTWEDTLRAHNSWHHFIQRKRAGLVPKRPLADILIGAFALRHQGLITRNPEDFMAAFPELALRVPLPKPPEEIEG